MTIVRCHRSERLAALVLCLAASAVGCGSGGEDRPAPVKLDAGPDGKTAPDGATDAAPDADVDASCSPGDQRSCKVTLAQHGNVVNCFVGMQYCQDGGWGDCEEPRDE